MKVSRGSDSEEDRGGDNRKSDVLKALGSGRKVLPVIFVPEFFVAVAHTATFFFFTSIKKFFCNENNCILQLLRCSTRKIRARRFNRLFNSPQVFKCSREGGIFISTERLRQLCESCLRTGARGLRRAQVMNKDIFSLAVVPTLTLLTLSRKFSTMGSDGWVA